MLMATGLMLYKPVAPVTGLVELTAVSGQATFMLPVVTALKAATPAFGHPVLGLMLVAKAVIKACALTSQLVAGFVNPVVQTPRFATFGTGGKFVLEKP